MNNKEMQPGDKRYFNTLAELQQFSIENGNPKSGYNVEAKTLIVVTKE